MKTTQKDHYYMLFGPEDDIWPHYVGISPIDVKADFVYCVDFLPESSYSNWRSGWKIAKKMGYKVKKIVPKNKILKISEKNY